MGCTRKNSCSTLLGTAVKCCVTLTINLTITHNHIGEMMEGKLQAKHLSSMSNSQHFMCKTKKSGNISHKDIYFQDQEKQLAEWKL